MLNEPSSSQQLKRQLTLFDSTCIIVGIIIGSGIYRTSGLIAAQFASATPLILCWICGGVIGLFGALCYARLAEHYPGEGGDYVYLSRAFGKSAGVLFAWCQFWIVRPGNIGAMAFVFADYLRQILGTGNEWNVYYAVTCVLILTFLNIVGVRSGKWTQNLLTTAKVVGLLAIVVLAFALSTPPEDATVAPPPDNPNLHLAMVLILFTYGGWNDMAFVTSEMKDPRRNIPRGLLAGAGSVTMIYVLLNLAFIYALGMESLSRSDVVASDLLQLLIGDWGRVLISLLICISCLGAINGMIFAGARIYFAIGDGIPGLGNLRVWNDKFDSPVRSLVVQAIVLVALILGLGLSGEGFTTLVMFITPFFFFFFLLSAIASLRLAWQSATAPFQRTVAITAPIIFTATCLFMLYAGIRYLIENPDENNLKFGIIWSLLTILSGAIAVLLAKRRR